MPDIKSAFKANFSGVCLHCDEGIEEGQWVLYDDDGQLIHAKHALSDDDDEC